MSAATRGGPTRLERAVAEARREIARSSGPIDLYDTTGQIVRAGLTVAHALRLLGDLEVHPARTSRFPVAALGSPAAGRAPRRLLFSDGVSPLDLPPGFERRSVFEPAINVGVIAFEAARSGNLVEAFVEVLNGSLEPVVAELLLDTASGEVLVRRPLQLAPAERWSGVIDLAPLAAVIAASPVLRARVSTAGDALASDDVAFAPVPLGTPLRVAVAGPEGTAVRRVLALLEGFSVRAVDLDESATLGSDAADVVVLEEGAPQQAPRLPALLIHPPPAPWLPDPAGEIGPSAWSAADAPVLHHLRVESVGRYSPTGTEARFLAAPASDGASAEAPLPLLLRAADGSWMLLPFAVEGSNLPEREGFPALLEALLLELGGVDSARVVEAGVLEVDDASATFEVASRGYAEIEQPTLLGANGARAVAPLGPVVSALNHTDWQAASFAAPDAVAIAVGAGVPWRHLLLAVALAVAAIELWTRSRGITE
jgi:hypothetical protein